MKIYPDSIPDWFSNLFKSYHWHGDRKEKKVFLTFDDGPTPIVTEFVMNELHKFGFEATFFCIGEKVTQHPAVYNRIIINGHRVGNHTHNHLDAWTSKKDTYLNNVSKCSQLVASKLFRPPYGHLTPKVANTLKEKGYKIVLWDVISGDFDRKRSSISCLKNLKKTTRNGSVVVFHDSDKAFKKLQEILPPYLKFLKKNGWNSEVL
ncbi:polysaccharide deacetylase family protein [Nonlabens sp.]|jgi:peptidoglycan/xylan/chitin deacetylase (PgdA/CDA1 family)|uniref:polysaccharide deacetylase family protein n=1 Tax=Nonlabens sp. TaxID=1888209 RepID=UPI0039E56381